MVRVRRVRLTAAKAAAARTAAETEAKRSFLRLVSHELRTPLNAIIGFSEVLANETFGPLGAPQYREYAEIVRSSGRELLGLVNQILEIARLEGGAADLSPCAEPLGPPLAEALASVSEAAAARGVRIDAPGAESLPCVQADTRALATMLDALLDTAVAASAEGGRVRVRVRTRGLRTVVAIADGAPGRSAEGAGERIGTTAAGPRRKGADLALPIAQLLAEASGGSLRLRSGERDGFAAVLSLPRG